MRYEIELQRKYVICDFVTVEAEDEDAAYETANKKFAELVRPLPPEFYGEVAEFCETEVVVHGEAK